MNPTISNWQKYQRFGCVSLIGKIENHPDVRVGHVPYSVTSVVRGKRNGRVVTSSGTEYNLGPPSKVFEGQAEDFINSLPELEV